MSVLEMNPLGRMTQAAYEQHLMDAGLSYSVAIREAARVYQHWGPGHVYAYISWTREVLYVGSTKDFDGRHYDHQRSRWFNLELFRPGWSRIWVDDLQPLRSIETAAQVDLGPGYLTRHGVEVDSYGEFQDRDLAEEFWADSRRQGKGLDWLAQKG